MVQSITLYGMECKDLMSSEREAYLRQLITAYAPGLSMNVGSGSMYLNRWGLQAQTKINEFYEGAIEYVLTSTDRKVLVFDFNTGAHTEPLNIVSDSTPVNLSSKKYMDLTSSQKNIIFEEFYRRAISQQQIIIDHHYGRQILSDTSTTPLVLDFLLWLHDRAKADTTRSTVNQAKKLLTDLETGFLVRDHSDADIILSHLLIRRSTDVTFLKKFGFLLSDIAMFNDHGFIASTSNTLAVLIGYYYFRAFEDYHIEHPETSFSQVHEALPNTLEWILDLSRKAASIEAVSSLVSFSENLHGLLLQKGLDLWQQASKSVSTLSMNLNSSNVINSESLEKGTFSCFNRICVASLSLDQKLDAFQVLQHFKGQRPEVIDGKQALVVITRTSSDVGPVTNIKLRSLNFNFDLTRVFNYFRETGLSSAGGRSSAGSLFGKSGQANVDSNLIFSIVSYLDANL